MGTERKAVPNGSIVKFNACVIVLLLAGTVFLILAPNVCAPSNGTFNPPHSDFGMDTDSDSLHNYLVVNVSITVTSPGDFFVAADLYDNSGMTYITSTFNMSSLTVGNHVVAIWFQGYEIYSSGINGPYQVQLMLFSDMGMDMDFHLTNMYLYTDFDPPPALFSPPHNDHGIDTDTPQNGLFNYLVVNTNISVTASGTFEVSGTLVDSMFNYIDSNSNMTFLNAGLQTVELRFYGPAIYSNGEDGPFEVYLDLYDDNKNVLDSDIHATDSYLYSDFDLPPATLSPPHYDFGLDTDTPANGLFDYLVVRVNVTVVTAGSYELTGDLLDDFMNFIDDDSNITFLEAGPQTVELRFYGPMIYNWGEDGPYFVDLYLYDDGYHQLAYDTHTTNFYSYTDFDLPPATFAPPHSDYGLDTDSPANGLFNHLVVEAEVSVTEAGTYQVTGLLIDSGLNMITYKLNTSYLGVGSHPVELRFYGPSIYTNGVDGPFTVILDLSDSYGNALGTDMHVTNPYSFTDFDTPPATLSLPYIDFGLDTDTPPNGLYDFLVIDVNVTVTTGGNYTVLSFLSDGMQSAQIVGASNSTYLAPGNHTLGLYYEGWVIGLTGIDGPYWAEILLYDEDMNVMEMDSHSTNTYIFTEFESTLPSLVSNWAVSPPNIDGIFSPGEWSDAVCVDLLSIVGNGLNASLLVKNDAENLYICYDAVGDTTQEPDDGASVSFDTKNDDVAANRREDQFAVGDMDNNQAHYVYSAGYGDWLVEDSPFDNLMVNHGTLASAHGFGTSDNSSTDHRIYEFQIPLALLGTALGDTIGFAGVSTPNAGVMDDTRAYSLWPAFFAGPPSLKVYGNLTLAPSPAGNVAPTLTKGSVSPAIGVAGSTLFTYKVTYRDADNDPPQSPYLWINKSGVPVGGPYQMIFERWVGDSGSYVSGAIYSHTGTIADCGTDYMFTFNASDGTVNIFCTEQTGPDVLAVPEPPKNLGVQGYESGTEGLLNITDHTPDLNWTFLDLDSAVQAGYNVSVRSAPGGGGMLMWWDNQTSSSSTVTYGYNGNPRVLQNGANYYLRVRTVDGDDLWGDWAEVKFHMNTQPPTPGNVNPPNGAYILNGTDTVIHWNTVSDAEGSQVEYHWCVSTDPAFSSWTAMGNTTLDHSTAFPYPSGEYFWRVRAYDGYEYGQNSTTWGFNVTDAPNLPVDLAVNGHLSGTPESLNLTDHTPDISWTFTDPDGDSQGGYNVTVWTGPGGTGTLMWWDNQTGTLTAVVYSGPALIHGDDYYIRIKTKDEHGFWGGWAEMKFHMNTPPTAPTNNEPSNGIYLLQSSAQTVRWEDAVDDEGSALTYYWYVASDSSFSSVVESGTTASLMSSQFETSAGTYYWRVRAHDGYEFGSNGTTWSFMVTNPPDPPVNLGIGGYLSGTPGSLSMIDHTPEFNWTFSDPDGDSQDGFNVTVWTGPGGTGTLMWWYNVTGPSASAEYSGSELMDGEDYHLLVKTKDEHGFWGGWAEMMFHMNEVPPVPVLKTPGNGTADIDIGLLELKWNTVSDPEGSAVWYEWMVSPDGSFSEILANGTITDSRTSFVTSPAEQYHWRVRAFDGYERGGYSAVWNFTTRHLKGGIAGSVTDEKGNLAADVKLELYDPSDILVTETLTDSGGQYSIQDVPPGTGYYLTASKEGFESNTTDPFTVSDQQNTYIPTIQIRKIPTKGSVTGNVKDEDGKPVRNAKVELKDPDGNTVDTTYTDSEGNFEFGDVEPASYTIEISKDGYKSQTSGEFGVEAGEEKTVPSFGLKEESGEADEPFPLWIVLVMAIAVVVVVAVVFLFMRRKKGTPEEVEVMPGEMPRQL